MPSPGAVFDAFEYSRVNRALTRGANAQQSLAATARELDKANAMFIDETAKTWLWSSRAKALEDVVEELKSRYPQDPLFRQVGGKHSNGKPRLVLHQKIEAAFNRYFTVSGPTRARALQFMDTFQTKRTL